MGIIKALKLMHDYYKYDENGHIEETHRALDDINLDIEQGQFIAVLGHNGSGKSTLAKHIMGGVTVGRNSVIGAGSVVTKSIPENVIAAGVPCKVIREITDEDKTGFLP